MSKGINRLLDAVIVLLTLLCCAVGVMIIYNYYTIAHHHNSELKITNMLEQKDYGNAIQNIYYNEYTDEAVSDGMKECEAVADYIEASYLLPVYEKMDNKDKIKELEKRINADQEAMGKLNLDWIRE